MKPRAKPAGVTIGPCLDCLGYSHPDTGRCNWDPDAPCAMCGLAQGYPTTETRAAGKCWWCVWQKPRPGPRREWVARDDGDFDL